ncbi:MAG TPA: protein kinase [Gemmataceae bacterium]|nr:protein kinase [Gemmataceae bacterium]
MDAALSGAPPLNRPHDVHVTRMTPIPGPARAAVATDGPIPPSYLRHLIDAALISADAWEELPREQQGAIVQLSPDNLLDALVAKGLLTLYQTDRIRSGSTHGLVIGNYRVLSRIGAGGMGIVFKAEQIKLRRPVALKLLAYGNAFHPRLLHRFWAETRAVAQLQHPHIVTAIDAGELPGPAAGDPSMPYFVMEYLEGRDLDDFVIKGGPMDVGLACKYLAQIADALTEAHRLKLVHRDLKPSNVFVTSRGQAKLLDFGLARQGEGRNVTEAGALLGTVGYMAPEQARDARTVDERADLFSLGCCLYWTLTGRPPFTSEESGTFRRPPTMRSLRSDVPAELDELVRRLLAEKPADRPRDAVVVYKALLPFVDGAEPVTHAVDHSPRSAPGAAKPARVLVVDDAPTVRCVCVQTLSRSGFDCVEVADAGAALDAVARGPFDVILLDSELPDLPGEDVLRRIRDNPACETVKVVLMGPAREAYDLGSLRLLGADDCLAKPFTSAQLLTLVKANLSLKERQDDTDRAARELAAENLHLQQKLAGAQTDLVRTRDFLMQVVSELIGERNYISSNRALRLQRYVRCLAQEAARMPLFKDEITSAYIAMLETWVPLMDVGHLLLPDYLLLKPAELSGDERELMQAHTTLGAELLTRIASKQPGQMGFFHMAITIARYHHERWDGSGYPDRLTGPEIPLPARVAALADVYDALRSQRVYRAAISHSAAVRAILDDSPGEFDPNLVQAFLRCEDLFEHVFRELPE